MSSSTSAANPPWRLESSDVRSNLDTSTSLLIHGTYAIDSVGYGLQFDLSKPHFEQFNAVKCLVKFVLFWRNGRNGVVSVYRRGGTHIVELQVGGVGFHCGHYGPLSSRQRIDVGEMCEGEKRLLQLHRLLVSWSGGWR